MNYETIIAEIEKAIPDAKHRKLPLLMKRLPKIYYQVLAKTAFLENNSNLSKRLAFIEAGLTDLPVCPVCGKSHERINDKKQVAGWCSKKCMFEDAGFTKGRLASVDQSERVKRMVATNLKKYGVEYQSQRKEVKEAIAKSKSLETINPYAHEKLMDRDWLETNYSEMSSTGVAKALDVFYGTVLEYMDIHGLPINHEWYASHGEKEIADFVADLGVDTLRNRRDLIGMEIDIYVPDNNFAIEFNGVFWHRAKPQGYHRDKMHRCEDKGVTLFQINSEQWEFKRELVKSMIASRLGKNRKIFARTCEFVEIDSEKYRNFCEENHIAGTSVASVKHGLIHEGELVMVMSYAKPRFDKSKDWELIRICSAKNVTIVGGASKLFARRPKGSIVSYCDLQYGTGNVYRQLGFQKVRRTKPGYYWADRNVLHNRMGFQKHRLAALHEAGSLKFYDEGMSETENMRMNGYEKYFDAGHDVWVFTDDP